MFREVGLQSTVTVYGFQRLLSSICTKISLDWSTIVRMYSRSGRILLLWRKTINANVHLSRNKFMDCGFSHMPIVYSDESG